LIENSELHTDASQDFEEAEEPSLGWVEEVLLELAGGNRLRIRGASMRGTMLKISVI
jgi:hypothetical protein